MPVIELVVDPVSHKILYGGVPLGITVRDPSVAPLHGGHYQNLM